MNASRNAQAVYTAIGQSFLTEEEDKQAECVLSLSTPSDDDKKFNWITVPYGGTAFSVYHLPDFKTYVENPSQTDPKRVYQTLGFMTTRMNRLLALPDFIKDLTVKQVTDELRLGVLQDLLEEWKNDQFPDDNVAAAGICGFKQLIEAKCTHSFDMDQAEAALQGHPAGTWLIRPSNMGKSDGSGDITVFTVSYVRVDGAIWHSRFVDVYGVGVYLGNLEVTPKEMLVRGDMKEIIQAWGHAPPPFACVTDALMGNIRQGYYKPSLLVYNSSGKVEYASMG